MKYLKDDVTGQIFAFESDGSQDHLICESLRMVPSYEIEQYKSEQIYLKKVNSERVWRDYELSRADIELNKVQDSDPKAKGTVTQWREYRKALRSLPEHEKFPSVEARPVAPDA